MTSQFYKAPTFDTIQLHGGQQPDLTTNARAVPLYQSATYTFKNSSHGADIFTLDDPGFVYARLTNPTSDVFEKRIAQLEGGESALAAASGLSAQFLAIAALAQTGDNIVSTSYLYGGARSQFEITLKKFEIGVNFIAGTKPEDFSAAIDDKTKAIYIESISSPTYIVFDIAAMAKVAHDHGIPLIVDNTLGMGGYLIRPIDHGADIVVHSGSEWIGGHGTAVAGVIVDSGKFDWRKSGRFPGFTEPTDSYHGLIYTDKFGSLALVNKVRAELLRDLGLSTDPFAAFLLLHGLETLTLRCKRHSKNGLALAKWLEKNPNTAWVSYLGLESHGSYEIAKKLVRPGVFGGMVSFGIKGDAEVARKLLDSLKMASNVPHVGDAKTLVIHPASTTHSQLNDEERLASGVTPELIRVSVGIEDINDIVADFEGAFGATFSG